MYTNFLRNISTLATGFLLISFGASGQKISMGVIAGGSLTSAFPDRTYIYILPSGQPAGPGDRTFSPSKDYLIGGMLELRLNPNWSVEVDGMFRKLHMTEASVLSDGSLNSVSPSPVITWEFPVLAKYRFQGWKVNPFVEAGPSFRTAGNLNGTDPSHHGIATGLGIETHWRSLKIAPSVRYTRWASEDRETNPRSTAPNQVELLVGFSSEAESNWRPLGRRVAVGLMGGSLAEGRLRCSSPHSGYAVLLKNGITGDDVQILLNCLCNQ
jgi:hypothetical protein